MSMFSRRPSEKLLIPISRVDVTTLNRLIADTDLTPEAWLSSVINAKARSVESGDRS